MIPINVNKGEHSGWVDHIDPKAITYIHTNYRASKVGTPEESMEPISWSIYLGSIEPGDHHIIIHKKSEFDRLLRATNVDTSDVQLEMGALRKFHKTMIDKGKAVEVAHELAAEGDVEGWNALHRVMETLDEHRSYERATEVVDARRWVRLNTFGTWRLKSEFIAPESISGVRVFKANGLFKYVISFNASPDVLSEIGWSALEDAKLNAELTVDTYVAVP